MTNDVGTPPRTQELTVGGAELPTSEYSEVINPATGDVFAHAPSLPLDRLDDVFDDAHRAFSSWRKDEDERRRLLHAAADAIAAAREEIAPILTSEQGMPIGPAFGELEWLDRWFRYFADLERPEEVVQDDAERYDRILRKPLGVVVAIAPFNFPLSLAAWKIAPALRAGNTVVLKPSPYTPLSALALGRVLRGVLPDGVLNVVAGPEPLGAAMVSHPVPRKVSFTGSTAVGRQVAVNAAPTFKRVTLELGGNDPAIVLDDAVVEQVAPQLFWSGMYNNGQICVAAKRIYAQEGVKDRLVEALADIAANVSVGDGFAPGVQLGPVNNRAGHDRMGALVQDAVDRGGRIVTGGAPLDRPGYFFPPTIVDRIGDDARVVAEEQFGPVMPVLSFRSADEVVERANDSEYGLTASVWSSDVERATAIATQLDTGQVSLNSHGGGIAPQLPFGGHKNSGLGLENGIWGLNEFTEMQVLVSPPRR